MNEKLVDHQQVTKNLLALKAELVGKWNNHNCIVHLQELIEKVNHCLHDNYPPKK